VEKPWYQKLGIQENLEGIEIPFKKIAFIFLAINLVAILIILAIQKILPPKIPLFYGLPEGEEQLTAPLSLIIPNLISFSIILIDIIFSFNIKDIFYKKIIIISGVLATLFSCVTVAKIIFLVSNF